MRAASSGGLELSKGEQVKDGKISDIVSAQTWALGSNNPSRGLVKSVKEGGHESKRNGRPLKEHTQCICVCVCLHCGHIIFSC